MPKDDARDVARSVKVNPRSREVVIADGIKWCARWSLRWAFIALGLVLLGYVVKIAWPILLPVLLALILCTVLAPVSGFMERRLRLPAGLAAALTMVGSLAVLVAIGMLLRFQVADQADNVAADASAGVQQVQDWVQRTDLISQKQIDSALQAVQDKLQGSASTIASGLFVGVSKVTSVLVTALITLVLTFLFLKDGRKFLPWLGARAGVSVGGHLMEAGGRSWQTLGGFIRTQALVSLIDAVFIGTGLVIVGVPLAIPLALLTFVGGFVPIIGAFVVGAVAVLVALVSNGLSGALIILVVIIVVQQLEGNVLSPWLQAKAMQLPAAVVLLSVMLGSGLFGIVGAFLAVPVVAVAAVILRYLDELVTEESTPPEVPDEGSEPTDADDRAEGAEGTSPDQA